MDTAAPDTKSLLIRRIPQGPLKGLVHAISAYEERGEAMHDGVEAASLVVPLIFVFEGSFDLALDRRPRADDRFHSFTAGLHPGHVRMDSRGDAECLQIDFTPIGARLFFETSPPELTSRMISLDDLADAGIRELGDRLADTLGWPERIRLAERYVIGRIAGAPRAVKPEILHACRMIADSRGDQRVANIARDLGWSRKRLVSAFRDDIGLSPKLFARIVRFGHATELAMSPNIGGWAEVAAACGYADQAHMTREFVEFSGAPPRRWQRDIGLRETGTFLQEPDFRAG
ncbi:helix-turn-helix domain-containing protein [Oricola sp.]|uniref:helix-turn-helix domain-containing protein n=1 Tax=Oricola sp. TaxID=1979950 RepID=UPI0035193DFB